MVTFLTSYALTTCTWCEILGLVDENDVIVVKPRPTQLVELEVAVVSHGDPRVVQILHLLPDLLSVRYQVLGAENYLLATVSVTNYLGGWW